MVDEVLVGELVVIRVVEVDGIGVVIPSVEFVGTLLLTGDVWSDTCEVLLVNGTDVVKGAAVEVAIVVEVKDEVLGHVSNTMTSSIAMSPCSPDPMTPTNQN